MTTITTKTMRALMLGMLGSLTLFLVAGCGDKKATTAAPTESATPTVTDAWARVTAPRAKTGAIYMTINGSAADSLVGASVPAGVAGRAELHEVVFGGGSTMRRSGSMNSNKMSGGGMTMRKLDALQIPAGKTVVLKPGGYHVMLFDLKKPISEGDLVKVTLRFEKAGELTLDAVARK